MLRATHYDQFCDLLEKNPSGSQKSSTDFTTNCNLLLTTSIQLRNLSFKKEKQVKFSDAPNRTELYRSNFHPLAPLLAEDVILELENQSISNDGTFYVGFQDRSRVKLEEVCRR